MLDIAYVDLLALTPAMRELAIARGWLDRGVSGVDGVVAKALDGRYCPTSAGGSG